MFGLAIRRRSNVIINKKNFDNRSNVVKCKKFVLTYILISKEGTMPKGKKIALYGCLGCGGFILLLIMLLVGGVGFLGYQGYQFGKELGETYKQVATGYNDLEAEFPFAQPQDDLLSEERVKTYLTIREQTAGFASESIKKLGDKGDEIGNQMEQPGIMSKIHGAKKIKEIITLATHLAAEIGQGHIQTLRENNMSPSEYQWLTYIYLGTLAKAEENGFSIGADIWKQYLDNFDKGRQRTKQIEMNIGRRHVRGNDINQHNLLDMIHDVAYKTENVTIIEKTIELFTINEEVGTIDFLALQLDDVIKELSHNPDRKLPDVEISKIPVEATATVEEN